MSKRILILFFVFIFSLPVLAEDQESFVRLKRSSAGEVTALEVAITEFESAYGLKVDLIGVVHIADLSYYKKLEKIFGTYDKVLYELIRSKEESFDLKALSKPSPVSDIQSGVSSFLKLAFQLSSIDYTATNFIHADLSPAELNKLLKQNGKTYTSLVSDAVLSAYQQQYSNYKQQQVMGLKLLLSMLSANRSLLVKKIIAEQLADLDKEVEALGGELYWLIIEERNKAALKVLKDLMLKGAGDHYAIFYGAGHMADFAKRLETDFGLRRKKTRWLKAWDLEVKN